MKVLGKILMALCIAALALCPRGALAAERDGINVSGEAVATISADMATIYGKVTAKGKTAQETREALATKLAAVKRSITLSGITQDKWSTLGYRLTPVYITAGNKQKQNGFSASSEVNIQVMDLAKLSKTLDSSITAGSLEVSRIEFGLQDRNIVERRLLREAVINAKQKAEIIASAGGRTLGALVNATVIDRMGEARIVMNAPATRMKTADGDTPTELTPGTIKVRTSVNVIFGLI